MTSNVVVSMFSSRECAPGVDGARGIVRLHQAGYIVCAERDGQFRSHLSNAKTPQEPENGSISPHRTKVAAARRPRLRSPVFWS